MVILKNYIMMNNCKIVYFLTVSTVLLFLLLTSVQYMYCIQAGL